MGVTDRKKRLENALLIRYWFVIEPRYCLVVVGYRCVTNGLLIGYFSATGGLMNGILSCPLVITGFD